MTDNLILNKFQSTNYFKHDDLEDGAKLMFEEEIGISEDEVQDTLTAKPELNFFRKRKPKDLSEPNYGCKEILDDALEIIHDNTVRKEIEADKTTLE